MINNMESEGDPRRIGRNKSLNSTTDDWRLSTIGRETFLTREEWNGWPLRRQWLELGSLGTLAIRWKEAMKLYGHVGRTRISYGVEYADDSRASVASGEEAHAIDTSHISVEKWKRPGHREERRYIPHDPTNRAPTERNRVEIDASTEQVRGKEGNSLNKGKWGAE